MFDNIDPKIREYGFFSFIVALVLSLILHFTLIDVLRGGMVYGFPFNLNDLTGLLNFLARIANSFFIAIFITPAIYFVIMKYIIRSI
jgi:hypothetical protein